MRVARPSHCQLLVHFLAAVSLERDFCRRRRPRQKGPEDPISAQRPEIGDHHTREMAVKTAFLLASYQLRVSGDWVVGPPGLEPGTRCLKADTQHDHHPSRCWTVTCYTNAP